MPRRPRKSAAAKARPVDRRDSKVKKWNKASDIPLDEEDQFHASRDKILLDGDEEEEDLDGDEEEVFGLDIDDDTEEDEEDQADEDDGDDEAPVAPTKSKSKKAKKVPSDAGSDEEEEGWGRGRSAYYSSNAAELDSDDEEANELEEQEARRLQSKTRDAMEDDDFGLDDVVDPTLTDVVEEDLAVPLEPVPQDSQSLIRHIEKTNPETLALARDWEDTAEALTKTRQKIAAMEESKTSAMALGMVHLHYQALLSYATALAFYLHLRSSPKYARRPELLRSHPVMGRLLTLKQSLTTLEDLDFAASDLDVDELDSSDDLMDADQLWKLDRLKGLEEGELEGLLGDAGVDVDEPMLDEDEEEEEPRPKKRRKTTSEQEKKKKKNGKAPALLVFDLVEPEFTSSKTEQRMDTSDDAYGEATFLQHADAVDKQARRKTLRFHTSKIESASARRQGARSQAIGGDDDIPYRDVRKQKQALRREQDAGEDLDDAEPPPKVSAAAEEDTEDAEGYYELVKRASKEKKEKKKADYEAAQAAARPDFEEAATDGPRSLTRAILTNKGLTPRRPKSVRNPRVKKREKFRKANMKVASQKAVFKGGLAETGRYDGERSGISKVVKSVRLG
ncbi:hypothetical protein MKEN_00911000 [Mycena kentingensis (nom. inval.)]|nr:hypothetical protein MKEN_00911000 [Mycena kentingensis (nom. inval.)]